MAATNEIYLPHKYFKEQAGLTNYDIDLMSQKYDFARQNDEGFPVFGMMKAINTERKAVLDSFGVDANSDLKDAKLDHELKLENIQAKRILNQMKLGILIPKEEASERVKLVFSAVMNIIKVGIKNASSRIHGNICHIGSQREVEIIITEEWNNAVSDLKENAKVISWEQDGSAKLLKTRLSDIEKEDPEFAELAKSRFENEIQ